MNSGADDFAELDAGLDVLQQPFARYLEDSSSGLSSAAALRNMCDSLRRGTSAWSHQFDKVCRRLHVGRP